MGLAEKKDGGLTAVNLKGDLVHFESLSAADKHPTSLFEGHGHAISDLISFDKFIVYSSEHRIFYFNVATPNIVHQLSGLPHAQNVNVFAQNSHSLYASTLDKFVLRFTVSGDGESLQLVKHITLATASASRISAAEGLVYLLRTNGEIDEINALELNV